jgi:hypothetical protein
LHDMQKEKKTTFFVRPATHQHLAFSKNLRVCAPFKNSFFAYGESMHAPPVQEAQGPKEVQKPSVVKKNVVFFEETLCFLINLRFSFLNSRFAIGDSERTGEKHQKKT